MNFKTTIFLTFLFLFLIVFEGSSKDSLAVNDSTKNYNTPQMLDNFSSKLSLF
jgi:hypothetical protein